MRYFFKPSFLILAAFCCFPSITFASYPGDTLLTRLIQNWESEFERVQIQYHLQKRSLRQRLLKVNNKLYGPARSPKSSELLVHQLWERSLLIDSLRNLEKSHSTDITLRRYKKGLELIRLLYEKILALDHHFTTLKTYQNVAALSNPNTFPEFQVAQGIIEERLNKKSTLELPGLFESNPYLSAAFSVVASVIGDGDPKEREEELEQIACILDFTVRMNNELALIYYETEFLKESNTALKEDCQILFKDYVQALGYFTSLADCRKEDDWEKVYSLLGDYAENLKSLSNNGAEVALEEAYNMQVDLEFSVDRLLDFINKYSAFISQGEKYYQKFEIIANSYMHEETCSAKLPAQFSNLKEDIRLSIVKFKESYNITALKGSKLKDLLYGNIH
jgi:hypothetical protein